MGQYGNQPDFGTRAKTVVPQGVPGDVNGKLNSAALYIGTGGTLVCSVVGGNLDRIGQEVGYTVFTNIPNGTFFPVIVNHVWSSENGDIATTCSDIVALY